jgi:transketolase N-terminal domain/subunit
MLNQRDLQRKSVQYLKALLQLIKACGAGHTRGDVSCLHILNVLYNRITGVSRETFRSPDCDRYIQSKRTRKGKGASFMVNLAKWHHRVPNGDEFNRAMMEFDVAEAAVA